jgi:hypothetical protein
MTTPSAQVGEQGKHARLLGLYDQEDLKDAEPDTLHYLLWALPARPARHARQRVLKPPPAP